MHSDSKNISSESKNGDEEQPYEISYEGHVYDMSSVMDGTKLGDITTGIPKPNLTKKFFDIDKVSTIMQSLHEDHRRSQEMFDTFRQEHKKAMALKHGLIVLTLFAVVIAFSNIGTSFLATRLAKEMQVSASTNDLVNMEGERLSTTSKVVELKINPLPRDERRNLLAWATQQNICPPNNGVHECMIGAYIDYNDAVRIYKKFCPSWPNLNNTCTGPGGVSELIMNCNGNKTLIKGGIYIPTSGPDFDTEGWGYTVFPSTVAPYVASQELINTTSLWAPSCRVDIQMTYWCPTDLTGCVLFGNYDTQQCPGLSPQFCSND